MPDPELPVDSSRELTPRQDRIEAAIARNLRAGGTRSELRDAVYRFADLARMQQVPPERAIARMKELARQAAPSVTPAEAPVGDSLADRLAMIVRWCAARYHRVD